MTESMLKGLLQLAIALGLLALAWWLLKRALIVLRALLRPVTRVVMPVVERADRAVADHAASALRQAGADRAAELVRKGPAVSRGLRGAVGAVLDAEEQRIQARRGGSSH